MDAGLTHHALKERGERRLSLDELDPTKLKPVTETGSGSLQDKDKAFLVEIIERVNDLFGGDATDGDKVSYLKAIREKLLESEALGIQAVNNEKARFANSPTLGNELMNAIIDELTAHNGLSKQALDSERVRAGLKDVLLGPAMLYEMLKVRHSEATPRP